MSTATRPQTIIYTLTDEAPALATRSFLPIVRAFSKQAGINIETQDISLAKRLLAVFPDYLSTEQHVTNSLAELGKQVTQPHTNIIKLPNISASIPQLQAAIKELQDQGYPLPDYPETIAPGDPDYEQQADIKKRYDSVKGSAVNPVLREGNSDRRAPKAVKQYAQTHPHSMGEWHSSSNTHVASMAQGDFYGSENATTLEQDSQFKIELHSDNGQIHLLKDYAPLLKGEIIDTAVMSKNALCDFLTQQFKQAKDNHILVSIHLKATMMKVSDPIIFGHAVAVYFQSVFEKHQKILADLDINPNNGLADLLSKLKQLPHDQEQTILNDIQACYNSQPDLAMVNSDAGITNLHVPSDVIIDASMPAAIRSSGKMWGKDGQLHDTKAIIPDRCYAGIYQETINFCKHHGAFDPTSMGTVQNVGLMAQKAEEYGSHDKTFEIAEQGVVRVIDDKGHCLLEQNVAQGDIWRMCQVKQAPIQDWVKLAVNRARSTQLSTIFWLDEQRAHDAQLIKQVNSFLKDHDCSGLDIRILSPKEAMQFSLAQIKEGKDCISVTGNVLRDYLTDLFPILELGTSAKMLSIVPLMKGGGLFETGAGGSAPKHVQQLLSDNHLRWDSLGEFLALTVSLEYMANTFSNNKAQLLADTLDQATAAYLHNNKSPSRKTGELDNRGSHFYLTLYWAKALAEQTDDKILQQQFSSLAQQLIAKESDIVHQLSVVQGKSVDLNGYYLPDETLAQQIMRPSPLFNHLLSQI